MYNKLRLLLCIFLLSNTMFLFAESNINSIQGFVYDQTTGEKLSFVNIVIKETNLGTITNENGYFHIKELKPGIYDIQVSHIGYKVLTLNNISIKKNKTQYLKIGLKPTIIETNAIVVTATRSIHTLKDVPLETYLINRKEIKGTGVQTLTDIIRWVPGVTISGGAPNGAARRFTSMINGLPSQYSMILIDGERAKSEHIHTGVNLNLIPVEMIDRVEVVKGPVSALYGSDAFGGIINIITKPIPQSASYGANFSYGKYNTRNINLYHGNSLKKFGYYVNINQIHSDGVPDASDIQFDYDQLNFLGKLTYTLSNRSAFSFNSRVYRNKYLRKSTIPKVTDYWTDLSTHWRYKIEKKTSFKTSLYYSHFKGEYRDDNNRTIMGESVLDGKIGNLHSITTGLEIRNEEFSRAATPEKITTILSGFIKDELLLNSKIIPVLALRADYHPKVGTVWTPKVGGLYRLSSKTDIRASIGKGFRAPSLQDLYEDKFDHKTYYRDGNIHLKPEYSMNYNISAEHFFTDNLIAKISGFRNEFKDMIMATNSGEIYNGRTVLRRENIQKALAQGIESEIRAIIGNMRFVICHTYANTKDEDDFPIAYSPQHLTTVRLYKYFPKVGFYTFLSLEKAVDRYYKTKEGNKDVLQNYTLLNLSMDKRFTDQILAFIRIENLLNAKFEIYEDGKSLAGFGYSILVGINLKY